MHFNMSFLSSNSNDEDTGETKNSIVQTPWSDTVPNGATAPQNGGSNDTSNSNGFVSSVPNAAKTNGGATNFNVNFDVVASNGGISNSAPVNLSNTNLSNTNVSSANTSNFRSEFAFDLSPQPFESSTQALPSAPEMAPLRPFDESSGGGDATKKRGGILAAILALAAKFKFLLVALKFGKVATTALSMLASIGVYSLLWGWKFALGFVLMILIHEMGHVFVAWRKGLPVSAPMFVPLMGAFILLKKMPQDALSEAQIGIGGPAAGALGDTLLWGLFYLTREPLLLAVASVSMMNNLFNMMPISPLDGGRITAAISPRLWIIGLIGMAVWFYLHPNPIMLAILVLGALRVKSQWSSMNSSEYFRVPQRSRVGMTLMYLGLALYLGWAQHYTHNMLSHLHTPRTQAVQIS